jgi:SSS family transporter
MIRSLLFIGSLFVAQAGAALSWNHGPEIPDSRGLAAVFAGTSEDTLIVAGGANFPDAPPWEGGSKVWHDRIWTLRTDAQAWAEAGRLPQSLAYGASVSTPDGVICIGGSDATKHYSGVFRMRAKTGAVEVTKLPPLPIPLANLAAAMVAKRIHVIGGTTQPESTEASQRHFAFDGEAWQELPPLPAVGRIFPVVASRAGEFFVFSGASLQADSTGKAQRTYLQDAWKYDAKGNWQRLSDLPRPAVAAPSPAIAAGASHFLIVGGDDGTKIHHEPKSTHPGFARDVLSYDTITGTWASQGSWPAEAGAAVTAPVVAWQKGNWIISGEIRPAVRTPQIVGLRLKTETSAFGMTNWIVVLVYLAGMVGIGYYFMKREAASTTDDYFRGGQRVPAWVAGLSIFATMLSALTFMGIPARAYKTDISWYLGQLPILLIIPLVVICYLPFFRKLDLTSAYEYLELRFSFACRLFASLSFTAFHLGRIAIVLYLPALALATVSDIDVVTSILLIGVLCLIYTVMGGIEAVVWTDAVQAIVLMAGALLCFVLAVWQVDGGISGVAQIAIRDHKLWESLEWKSLNVAEGTNSVWILFLAFFFNSLVPYTASQDVVQRYVTTRDIGAAKKSLHLTLWMSLSGGLLFFLLGTAIYAFYQQHPERLDPALASTDSILPFYIFHELPAGVSGLIIAAIFAAAQSTISSSLNSVATTYVKDIDARWLRPGREDKSYLRSAQLVVIIAGGVGTALAVVMAKSQIESAFATFNAMIGLTAGSLGGLFALGIFTRSTNSQGAFLGALAGFVSVVALYWFKAPISGLLYAAIGFGVCFLVGITASRFLPGRGDATLSWRKNS